LTASAGVLSPFAISRYSIVFFSFASGWKHGQLNPLQSQQGHTLFTLPCHLTLSTRTSTLPSLIGEVDWKEHGLHIGWAGLILCLMWEAAQGSSSKWSTYLGMDACILPVLDHLLNRRSKASLPIAFDTPMFWSSEDLEQLRGTAVLGRSFNQVVDLGC
jgi:SET domain-containing protein 6